MPSKRKYPASPTAVRLSTEMRGWIERVAAANDRDASWVIRYCVDEMRASGRLATSRADVVGMARKAGGA